MVRTPTAKAAAKKAATKKGRNKSPRTISVDENNFKALQILCIEQSKTVSDVIDDLIEAYIEETKKS